MLGAVLGFVVLVAVAAWRLRIGFVAFRKRFRRYLADSPDIAWQRETANGFLCTVSGVPLQVDLLESYIFRLRHRGDEQDVFAQLVAGLRHRVPPAAPPPFPLVQDRVLPLIKREADLIMSSGYRRQHYPVRSAFVEDLVIAYVIEGQFQMTYVTEGMVSAWGLGAADLHPLAMANLRDRTRHLLDELGGPQRDYVELDGYDATRALVPDLLVPAGLRNPILAIPHEHACLIAGADEHDDLASRAMAMYLSAELPLTPTVFAVSTGGPVPFGRNGRPGAAAGPSEAQSQVEP